VEDIKDVESPEDASSVISIDSKKDSSYPEIRYVDGLKSVLLLQKRKGPKKVLKWKTDLESIRYFELDETERVNVTKTFTDMKQMEKQNEREAFQMARKLSMYTRNYNIILLITVTHHELYKTQLILKIILHLFVSIIYVPFYA